MNLIYPYKNRVLDKTKPVWIYRNLHGGGKEKYSIRQNGLVVGHTNQILLKNCNFIVNRGGQNRVTKTGRKNVHAFIKGLICCSAMGYRACNQDLDVLIHYNPHEHNSFVAQKTWKHKERKIESAPIVMINKNGVSALGSLD